MGYSNFEIFDPNLTNLQDDGTYSTDIGRQGGVINGIASPSLYNKQALQASLAPYAIGQILANTFGYTCVDSSPSNLIIQYQNILTPFQGTNAQTGTAYTIAATDRNQLITFNNASAISVTLPQAGSGSSLPNFQNFFSTQIVNLGAGVVTITPSTSTIDGAASITLEQNEGLTLFSDNTNYFTNRGKGQTPAGIIAPYAGSTAPVGWLICDGSAISRTTYVKLFTAISTTFGNGDGSTTFNLPDLRGRFPLGRDSMGAGAAGRMPNHTTTLAATGGEEMHVLTKAQLPILPINYVQITAGSGANTVFPLVPSTVSPVAGNDTGYFGSGNGHENTPLYQALTYLIKF